MHIVHTSIKIRELIEGYNDDTQTGRVSGYNGKLDIRPAYQREFVYKEKQREAVINTIRHNLPLNVIYWAKTGNDTFEVLDGQQRTISICQYCHSEFSIDYRAFHNLTREEKEQILNYELDVYQCDGPDKEKLDWFKIVNIAGVKLTDQELRNAVYAGTWLSDAKKRFSARNCAAERMAKDYMTGSCIRQDYLEAALTWISAKESDVIENYMSIHQHDSNANELWLYFQSVINWVKVIYPNYRKEMKGVEWGDLYNKFHDENFDAKELEEKVVRLMRDEDVTKKSGIYAYLLDEDERHLSIRAFSENMKREAYERQQGICAKCNQHFSIDEMEADHIIPWSKGGKTIADNCQMLCKDCNRQKSGK